MKKIGSGIPFYMREGRGSEGTNPWRYLWKGIPEDRKASAKILRQELAWYS